MLLTAQQTYLTFFGSIYCRMIIEARWEYFVIIILEGQEGPVLLSRLNPLSLPLKEQLILKKHLCSVSHCTKSRCLWSLFKNPCIRSAYDWELKNLECCDLGIICSEWSCFHLRLQMKWNEIWQGQKS